MYYRTLGTIQKSLTDSQLVYPTVLRDKLDQEFYAMTAYAELRKKMQKDPPRKLLESKLEELLKTQQIGYARDSKYLVIIIAIIIILVL